MKTPNGIPSTDLVEFFQLSQKNQKHVQALLVAIGFLFHADNKTEAARAIAAQSRDVRGFSASTLLRTYRRYMERGGDWRELVPNYKPGRVVHVGMKPLPLR